VGRGLGLVRKEEDTLLTDWRANTKHILTWRDNEQKGKEIEKKSGEIGLHLCWMAVEAKPR